MGLGYSRIYETLLSQPLSFRKLPVSLFGSRAWSRFPKITPADAAASHECMPGVGKPYHSAGEGHLHAMWTVPMTNRMLFERSFGSQRPGLETAIYFGILKDRNACRSKVSAGSIRSPTLFLASRDPCGRGLSLPHTELRAELGAYRPRA